MSAEVETVGPSARRLEEPDQPRESGTSLGGVILALAAVCLWVLWRTGPGKVPGVEGFENIARGWPTIDMTPQTAYVLRVPLGQIAYGLLPRQGSGAYLALHLSCLIGTAIVLVAWMCHRLGTRAGLVAGGVLALAPVTAVLLLWIGMYDAFSVFAWVVLVVALAHRGPWQLAAAALAGFQNFEQVVVGVLMLLLLPRLTRSLGLRPRALWLVPGVLAGKVALELYLRSVGATPGSRLTFLSDWDVFSHVLGTTAANGPLIIWSALAGLWGFALTALVTSWGRWPWRDKLQLLLAVGVWFVSAAITADHTRVLAITSFPVVVLGAMAIADRHRDLGRLVRMPQTWLLVLATPVVVFDYITLPLGIKPDLWGVWLF